MGWIIYNSRGEPLVAQEQHDHTVADASGPMTNDEHDGYSEYEKIAIPSIPAADEGRLFSPLLTGNDSIVTGDVGIDETGLYYRRPDGLMVKLSDDFPYTARMRHPTSTTYPHGGVDELALANSWVNYSTIFSVAAFVKDYLGCVWVQGLVKSGTVGLNVFKLPEGYRDTGGSLRWATVSNGLMATLDQHAGGEVEADTGSNVWFSLSPMAFPITGRVTWHEVGAGGEPAFENSWVNYGLTFETAGFAKDALGRVWIKGLIKDGDDNTTVFTLPVGYRPSKNILTIATSNSKVVARIVVGSDGQLVARLLGAGNNDWFTIVVNFTADGEESAPWREIGAVGEPAFENSWVNFEGDYNTAAFYKDAAGVVHIKGLVKAGTLNTPAFTLPVGYRPRRRLYIPALSNNLFGRFYVLEGGEVQPISPSNAWFNVDFSFVAEQ